MAMVSQSRFTSTRRSQPHITVPPQPPANAVQHAAQRNATAAVVAAAAGLQNTVLEQTLDFMGEVVQRTNAENRRSNTKAAYDPKVEEYYQFCNHFAHHIPLAMRYTVTHEKLYAFLVYQAFREQRTRGGGKRRSDGTHPPAQFDPLGPSLTEKKSVNANETRTQIRVVPSADSGFFPSLRSFADPSCECANFSQRKKPAKKIKFGAGKMFFPSNLP